ncbi:MAG TPA: DUF3857 domain-containing protein [Terracidiphilus sp.]|nr:DUF3857 domain-containing protein [Terracidiphilus sp.]
MKTQVWMAGIVLAGAVLLSQVAAAQKFQEPTKEELQMTSDPKAPDAPAVYLYREDTTDNRSHYIGRYARIKVLTEKGKEWATVEVPYVPGYSNPPIIEARTIHPDGTVIPLQGKGEDLLAFKTNRAHVKVAVFNMPSVEVGSILEYKWTIPLGGGRVNFAAGGEGEENYYASALASSVPEWEVQQDLYVHKEHFYFNPVTDLEANVIGNPITYFVDGERASYRLFTQRLPAGDKVTESPKQDYTLDVQDIPAFKQVANAPPEDSLRYRVHFYYTPYTTPKDYWENEIKRWSRGLDQYAEQTQAIREAAAQMTAGAATDEAKARKLYDAVQALDNTEFSRTKSESERRQEHLKAQAKRADDVLREKSGSANDLAALFLALARAAGLQADGLKIASRNERLFDMNYLSLRQLDTLLVVLHLNGKDVYVDPGEKLCPFGQLGWAHTMAGGLQENLPTPTYTPANLTKDAITAHAADLAVDATGSVSGTVQLVMNGPAALHWRQLNLMADSDEVKKQLTERLHRLLPAGMNAEIAAIKGLETADGFVQATAKVSGAVGTVTGKRVLMPAFLFSSGDAEKTFVSEDKREWPVDLHYAEQVIDDVVYHLPAGYQVESAPQAAQLPWPDHAALVVKVTADPAKNTLDVRHTFARAFALLDAKEYPALHDYYQKIATNDQQQVVLTAGARAAGQ